jgi:hypothetical protein
VNTRDAEIVRKLAADAAKGDTRAAAELRRWKAEYPEDDGETDLTKETDAVLAHMRDIARAELGESPA